MQQQRQIILKFLTPEMYLITQKNSLLRSREKDASPLWRAVG
jgi:hypothetical protein